MIRKVSRNLIQLSRIAALLCPLLLLSCDLVGSFLEPRPEDLLGPFLEPRPEVLVNGYHRSPDGSTEVQYLWDDVAVFKRDITDGLGETRRRYDLNRSSPGMVPDYVEVTGDIIHEKLLSQLLEICVLPWQDSKLVIARGIQPLEVDFSLSLEEMVAAMEQNKPVYLVIIPGKTAVYPTEEEARAYVKTEFALENWSLDPPVTIFPHLTTASPQKPAP